MIHFRVCVYGAANGIARAHHENTINILHKLHVGGAEMEKPEDDRSVSTAALASFCVCRFPRGAQLHFHITLSVSVASGRHAAERVGGSRFNASLVFSLSPCFICRGSQRSSASPRSLPFEIHRDETTDRCVFIKCPAEESLHALRLSVHLLSRHTSVSFTSFTSPSALNQKGKPKKI